MTHDRQGDELLDPDSVQGIGLEHFQSEPLLHEVLIDTFRGQHRWWNMLAFVFTFAGLAMAILAAYQFFQAESTQAMIAWATCFLFFAVWVAMLKIWFWLEIQKNSLAREIKRLELQVALLSRQVSAKDEST